MDFGAMFQTWIKVLTKPGEEVFLEERQSEYANLKTAIIWIIVAGIIAAIFGAIGSMIAGALGTGAGVLESVLSNVDMPYEARQQLMGIVAGNAAGAGAGIFGALCGTFFIVPIFFLIGSAIYFAIAKMFGGEGDFEEQTYLLATFTAPITILNAVIGIIPFLGGCVTFFISIYQLVLTYFAIKASHNLTSGKALLTVLVPVLVLFLCAICGIGAVVATIIAAAGAGGNF